MSKRIHMTYCGMDGEGATVAQAKQDAAHKIERLIADLQDAPAIVVVENFAKMVFRTSHGWASCIIATANDTNTGAHVSERQVGLSYGGETREAEILAAAKHCADMAWSIDRPAEEDATLARFWLKPYVNARDLDREAREMVSRWQWHRRYRDARNAGFDDDAARDHASNLRPLPALAA
jgi:hypothetical protein